MFNELKRKVFDAVSAGKIVIAHMDNNTVNVRANSEGYVVFSDSSTQLIKSAIDWIDNLNSNYDEFLDEVDELLLDIFNLARDINRARLEECSDIKVYLNITRCVVSVAICNGDDVEIYDKTAYLGDTMELDANNQELALRDLKDMIFTLDVVFRKNVSE